MSIRIEKPGNGLVVGRDSFVIAFFIHGSYSNILEIMPTIQEAWRQSLPGPVINWAVIGANTNKYTKYNAGIEKKIIDYLNPSLASRRKSIYLEICGGAWAHCPDYRFVVTGHKAPISEEENCLIELCYPAGYPSQIGYDKTINLTRQLAQIIPFTSGYASPCLMHGWEDYDHLSYAQKKLINRALRFPGYDLLENQTTASNIGKRSKGARWVTLLGNELKPFVDEPILKEKLPPSIGIYSIDNGIMLCAGEEPELGDINRAKFPIRLAKVSQVISPVTYFGDMGPFSTILPDIEAEELMERWEIRFADFVEH